MLRTAAARPPRPPLRLTWNNGVWKLFDPHFYDDVGTFGLRRDALAALGSPAKVSPANRSR